MSMNIHSLHWLKIGLMYLSGAVLTAVVTIALATALSGEQKDLADRVDRNAQVTKDGVASIVCILQIDPEARTDAKVGNCLELNNFINTAQVP